MGITMNKHNLESITSIENLVNNVVQKSEDLKTFSEKLKEADHELLGVPSSKREFPPLVQIM